MRKTIFALLLGIGISTHHILPSKAPSQTKKISFAPARHGNELCTQEIEAVAARNQYAHATLQNFLQQPLAPQAIPSIGLACSGGGSRAAIATLGVLRGLEKIGLLDGITYAAGVSGSTWTLTSWMYHQQMNLDELTSFLKEKLRTEFSFKNVDRYLVGQRLVKKRKNSKKLSINEIWGSLLTHVFLSTPENTGQNSCISDLAPRTIAGNCPIPLFTAVIGQTSPHYKWAEFSPFEIGSSYLNTWIAPSTFGKKFTGSVTNDQYPGESLGYLLGVFGSAYAANASDAWTRFKTVAKSRYDVTVSAPFLSEFFEKTNFRISPPHVSNFARLHGPEELRDKELLTFIDAGVACNLPFPPLLRRNVNVYIVCNASGVPGSLQLAQTYAQENGFPFPPIDFKNIDTKRLSIHVDKNNSAAPIIIYIPNLHKFPTSKLQYSHQEFDMVLDDMEKAVVEHVDLIKAAIKVAVAKKTSRPLKGTL